VAALLPYLAATVDLFARCRRRRIPIASALRSYRSRLGFWLWCGLLFGLFALLGVWPGGAARPPSLEGVHWPTAGLLGLACLSGPALLVWSCAGRYGLGWDAPWYVAWLYALGYAPLPGFVIWLTWAAGAGQLAALASGRYAPYPAAAERARLGPIRRAVRGVV